LSDEYFLIDTDGGIDDLFALTYALYERIKDIKAITTTSGNVSSLQAAYNIGYLIQYINKSKEKISIPVYSGAHNSITPFSSKRAFEIHGSDGFGNIIGKCKNAEFAATFEEENAVTVIAKNAKYYSNNLTIITLGPLTNIAIAYLLDPESLRNIKRIVAMGGVLYAKGNYNGFAEFNICYYPSAYYIILKSCIPLELITLYITKKCPFNSEDFFYDNSTNIFYKAVKFYSKKSNTVYLHDPLAVYVAFEGNNCVKKLNINIELTGEYTKGLADYMLKNAKRVFSP
jgi:inosine-uridine nucleoside N-ribohydrolase